MKIKQIDCGSVRREFVIVLNSDWSSILLHSHGKYIICMLKIYVLQLCHGLFNSMWVLYLGILSKKYWGIIRYNKFIFSKKSSCDYFLLENFRTLFFYINISYLTEIESLLH